MGHAVGNLGGAHRAVRGFGNDRGAGIDADARQVRLHAGVGGVVGTPEDQAGRKTHADAEVVEAVGQLGRVIDRGAARSGRANERGDGGRVGRVVGRHVHGVEGRPGKVDLPVQTLLFQVGQDHHEGRRAERTRSARCRGVIGQGPEGAGEGAVVVLEGQEGQADLLEVAGRIACGGPPPAPR